MNSKPTAEHERPWLHCKNEEIEKLYDSDLYKGPGKWMMFFPKSELDEKWKYCCELYEGNKLIGIHSMKVSTNFKNDRASCHSTGVVIFYCGPCDDEEKIISYGRNLLKLIPYSSTTGYIYYKTDAQTYSGTRATGQRKNHTYKLPVELQINIEKHA